jgi:predicted DCC family thiol-disulfide oxidoreductase YuxK
MRTTLAGMARSYIRAGLEKQVPATGLGIFRILFGLVVLQEIVFLIYFRHFIYDPIPFQDQASPVVHLFLGFWAIAAGCITLGYHTRFAAIANYLLWVTFVGFTAMWQDFDGGFDQFMIGSSLFLIFLPADRALSLDTLRARLKYSRPGQNYIPPSQVSVLAYYLPLAILMGFLYFDAAIHKLSAPFWLNGMGSWLPPTMPYYMSPLDMSRLLNQQWAERIIGYTLIAFQFAFLPLFWFKRWRVPLLLIGLSFHTGIVLSLNIYPFGFGMLVHYALLVPFAWWRNIHAFFAFPAPILTVFYDQECPLCQRTAIIIRHFDVLDAVDFKGLQDHARQYSALDAIPEQTLLTDIYALDRNQRLYTGVDTYIQILLAMRTTALPGAILGLPGIRHLARLCYRRIADNRTRGCNTQCLPVQAENAPQLAAGSYARVAGRLSRLMIVICLLQLNSTLHFGLFYRLNGGHASSEAGQIVEAASNAILLLSHSFTGITPHALYMHDHFQGYNHILGITYIDDLDNERWLPFVNEEGRIVTPNWGRIQSMWANVAVTRQIDLKRLDKGLMRVTAFWGTEIGLNLEKTRFKLKVKEIRVPMDWEPDLRHYNLRQPWTDLGSVTWKNGKMQMDIPDSALARQLGLVVAD